MISSTFDYINEIPAKSLYKYEYKNGALTLSKLLYETCPFNYGYLKDYLGEDRENLDCFVITPFNEPLTPGVFTSVSIEGSFELLDEYNHVETKCLATLAFDKSIVDVFEACRIFDLFGNYIVFCKGYQESGKRKVQNIRNKEQTLELFEKGYFKKV
jgi:inorganic pyrophosphatase